MNFSIDSTITISDGNTIIDDSWRIRVDGNNLIFEYLKDLSWFILLPYAVLFGIFCFDY